MTPKQVRAFEVLRHYLKDLHQNVHGPKSWTSDNDAEIRGVVEDLTDAGDTVKAVDDAIKDGIKHARLRGQL